MIGILVETVLGALTGYVTNDVALRQLFKAGGVVEKERASFVNLLVDMLQREILDDATMMQLAENEDVIAFFDALVHEIMHHIVPEAINAQDDDFMARYDAMLSLLKTRVAQEAVPTVAVNRACLLTLGDAVFAPEHESAWNDVLSALKQESLESLGIGNSVHQVARRFLFSPAKDRKALFMKQEDEWIAALRDFAEQTYPVLHDTCTPARVLRWLVQPEGDEETLPMATLVGWLGAGIGMSPALRDGLRLFLTHQLESVLQRHLPEVLKLVENLLAEHSHELETMLWASMEEALIDMREPFRSVVLKAARNRLDDEEDWLGELFRGLRQDEMQVTMVEALNAALLQQLEAFYIFIQSQPHPDAQMQAYYQRLPEGLRNRIQLQWERWLHRPILQQVTPEAWSTWVCSEGLDMLQRLLESDAVMAKLDQRLATFLQTPLDAWLPRHFSDDIRGRMQGMWSTTGRSQLAAWANQAEIPGNRLQGWLLQALETIPIDSPESAYRLLSEFLGEKEEKIISNWVRHATFAHLPAFVGRVTQERLDALSQADLRHLVLDLLGNEMRPLSYLGAGVGAVAGIATGITMSASGLSPDPQSGADAALLFAGRSLLYGGVGYGTNVMAVHGLFKPYQKRLGWQGLLPRNQIRFAQKMNEMADTYVLNDDIWGSFADRAKERWLGHRTLIVERMVKPSTLNVVAENCDRLWRRIPLSYGLRWMPEAFTLFCRDRHKRNTLACWLGRAERRLFARAIQNADWLSFWQKPLGNLSGDSGFEHQVAEGLRQLLINQMHQPVGVWVERAETISAQLCLPGYEKLYPLFQPISRRIIAELPALLWQKREKLAEKMADAIFDRLSRMMQMGFAMLDGERYLLRALEIFLDRYAPAYFQRHQDYFEKGLLTGVGLLLAERPISDLGLNWRESDLLSLRHGVIEAALLKEVDVKMAANVTRQGSDMVSFFMPALVQGASAGTMALGRMLIHTDQTNVWTVLNRRILEDFCRPDKRHDKALATALMTLVTAPTCESTTLASCLTTESVNRLSAALQRFFTLSDTERVSVVQPFLLVLGDRIYPPVVDFVREEGRTLVALIDLPVLTETRIASLDARELEQLVRQIANPYFHHVERMGWWGAVVAIPATAVAMVLQ